MTSGKYNHKKGWTHKLETKIKIGIGNTGKIRSKECNENNRLKHIGKKIWNIGLTKETDDRVMKYSKSNTGKKLSEEHRKKNNEFWKKYHMEHPVGNRKGILHTEEDKLKMSNGHINIPLSKEHREAISKGHLGKKYKPMSDIGKKNISISQTGRKQTEITKQKLRIIAKDPNWGWKKIRKNQIFPKKDTTIEVKIQNYLKQLGIPFFTHQYMHIEHGYQCDILIPSMNNLVIECDGDFIHCNPKQYSEDFVRYPSNKKITTAKEIWNIDAIRTKELIEKGFKVLRLWGNEIEIITVEDFKIKLDSYKEAK